MTIDNNEIILGGTSNTVTKEQLTHLEEKQKSDQVLLMGIMVGVVIFVVITFWIELLSMHRNYEQDKTILLQMNQQNSNYFDKILFLNNEVQDLKNTLDVTKAKNYLK